VQGLGCRVRVAEFGGYGAWFGGWCAGCRVSGVHDYALSGWEQEVGFGVHPKFDFKSELPDPKVNYLTLWVRVDQREDEGRRLALMA